MFLNIIKTIFFLMCIYIHTFFLIIYAHKKKFKKYEYEEMHFIDDDGINNNCDHGKKSRRKFMHGQMFVLVRIFLSTSSSMRRQMWAQMPSTSFISIITVMASFLILLSLITFLLCVGQFLFKIVLFLWLIVQNYLL